MVAKSDPIPTDPARWPGPSGRSRACNSHDTWGLVWGLGWAGPPGLKLGSPGAWRDPASSAVRRSHSRLRPRAGGTGRPHGQSPTAVTAAVERSSTLGLKQEPGSQGLQARGGSRGGQGRARSSGQGPHRDHGHARPRVPADDLAPSPAAYGPQDAPKLMSRPAAWDPGGRGTSSVPRGLNCRWALNTEATAP